MFTLIVLMVLLNTEVKTVSSTHTFQTIEECKATAESLNEIQGIQAICM